MRIVGAVLILGALACEPAARADQPASPQDAKLPVVATEVSLGTIPTGRARKSMLFSPDNRHVAYLSYKVGEVNVVVDGVELKPYTAFWGSSDLEFDSPTTLHLLAGREWDLFRVDATLAPVP